MLAVTQGACDRIPLEEIRLLEKSIGEILKEQLSDLCQKITAGEKLSQSDRQNMLSILSKKCQINNLNR